MIEAFIYQRKVQYTVANSLGRKVSEISRTNLGHGHGRTHQQQQQHQQTQPHQHQHQHQQMQLQQQHQQQQAMMMMRNGAMGSSTTQVSPPGMLPSPAGTTSTTSTPQNPGSGSPDGGSLSSSGSGSGAGSGAPGSGGAGGGGGGGFVNGGGSGGSSSHSRRSPSVASTATAVNSHHGASAHPHTPNGGANGVNAPPPPSIPVPAPLLSDLQNILSSTIHAATRMKTAQSTLSLPLLREHFPRTFGRMVYSTLSAGDEHEPDMEDEEGELFWPGQCVTGEGLGWVCLMGRSMVREFGREVGYRGVEGLVEKPVVGMR